MEKLEQAFPEFPELLQKYSAMVLRVAFANVKNMQDAQDIAQDVFLSVLTKQPQFESDEHEKAWLIRVTINRCHEMRRSVWHRRVVATDTANPAFANLEAPEQELLGSEVWSAVGRLPDDMRLIVHLHYYEGYPLEEIARMLDCKPATVRTRLHRARKRLKLDLEQEAEREQRRYERVPFADERS